MQDWLKTFHGANPPFPAVEIAVKAALALALGLLVGFEREWSNKDIGVRTFAMAGGVAWASIDVAQRRCGSDPDCFCQSSRLAGCPKT